MHPIFQFFHRDIPAYGIMAVTGALAGLLLSQAIAIYDKRNAKYRDDLAYIYVFGLVGAAVGAKLLYLMTVLPSFFSDLAYIVKNPYGFFQKYFAGGFVFFGGVFGAIFAAYREAKAYRVQLRDFFPSLLPAVALFSAIGRIGCLLAGCCYGCEVGADCPIAIVYPPNGIAPAGVPLMPVPLIEAGFDLMLMVLMIYMTRPARSKPYALQTYIGCYAAMRFVLEFFRGDSARGIFGFFSTSQWISLAILAALIFVKKFLKEECSCWPQK